MTPEEAARAIAVKWFMDAPYMYHEEAPQLIADIAAAIRDAYERAATTVEGLRPPDLVPYHAEHSLARAAAAIRALKGETT